MRAATAGLVLLLAGPALGFDSVCFLATGGPCTAGPEAARNRWLGPSDEHRALLEFSRIFGGLPGPVSEDFTLTVFTSDQPVAVGPGTAPSLEPLNFFDARRAQDRTMSVPEFAELPDHGFALWDWARGLELCPLDAALTAPAGAVDCHDFSTHMGAVNSNHFVPQAQFFYQYYHALALDRAAACAEAESRITSRGGSAEDFRSFLQACEDEALVIEATGQHFLQDAWSTGHMWERWGSPDLADFSGISQALLVAITSGLIHGAKAVLEDIPVSHPDIAAALATAGFDVTQYTWNDPLCAPAPDVTWVGPGQTTPAPGAGDLFLTNLIAGQGASFPDQYRRLFSCAAAGLRTVYDAAGAQHGPLGPLAPGLDTVDPASDACFGQRATNHAMARGIGLDFTDPTGAPQRIELNSQLAAFLVPALSTQVGATVTPFTVAQFRIEMGFVVTQARLRDLFAPTETDLAEGGLGTFMGVDRNLVYVNHPLAPYVDPPLPWPAAGGAGGDDAERATWLARVFHRAHATEWCNRFRAGAADFLDVDALRSKVETLRSIGAGPEEIAAACTVCEEFAARHLRVGNDETDYDTAREPLCHFVADDPANAQYVFQPGDPSDTLPDLTADYCGCGSPPTTTTTTSSTTTSTIPGDVRFSFCVDDPFAHVCTDVYDASDQESPQVRVSVFGPTGLPLTGSIQLTVDLPPPPPLKSCPLCGRLIGLDESNSIAAGGTFIYSTPPGSGTATITALFTHDGRTSQGTFVIRFHNVIRPPLVTLQFIGDLPGNVSEANISAQVGDRGGDTVSITVEGAPPNALVDVHPIFDGIGSVAQVLIVPPTHQPPPGGYTTTMFATDARGLTSAPVVFQFTASETVNHVEVVVGPAD